MALVETIRQLWQRKLLVGLVLVIALAAAIFSSYKVSLSPFGLEKRALTVAAASSQILVDSPDSTLVEGAELGTFEALATRAKIYGQYLASLSARQEIAKLAGVPARSIATSGPFSSATGQIAYSSQSSEERAGELLQEGATNRLVFTAQEGVPILTVDAQSATSETAIALAGASFATLKHYVSSLEADGKPVRQGVTVRELGAPEGGTLGGSNNIMLMGLAFLVVFGLGCAAILMVPTFARRWRALDDVEYPGPGADTVEVPSHPPLPHADFEAARLVNGEPRDPLGPHAAHSR
jgi:hypothetical protein